MTSTPPPRLSGLLSGSLATTVGIAGCNFLTNIALARLCGPSILGEFVFQLACAHVAYALLSAGFDQSYIRQNHSASSWGAACMLTAIQVVLLLTVPVVVLHAVSWILPGVLSDLSPQIFKILLVTVAATIVAELLLAPLAVRLEYRRINLIRAGSSLTAAGVALAVGWFTNGQTIAALVVREVVMCIAMLVLALLFSYKPPVKRVSVKDLYEFVVYSSGLWRLNILERLIQRIEYLVIGLLGSAASVGNYFALRSFFDSLYGLAARPIQTVLFSYMCRNSSTSKNVSTVVSQAVRVRTLVSGILAIWVVAYLAGPLLQLIFGSKFQVPPSGVATLAVASMLLIAFEVLKVITMAKGAHGGLIRWRIIQLLTILLALPLFFRIFGTQGATLAFLGSVLVLFAGSRRVFISTIK